MRFRLPGTRLHVRFFERVETSNDTYDIFDLGVDFADGKKIDSIAVGGSFASAKEAIRSYDAKKAEEATKSSEPSVEPVVDTTAAAAA